MADDAAAEATAFARINGAAATAAAGSRDAATTPRTREAYASLLMGDQWRLYTEVALVWAASIRRHDRRRDIVLLTTPDIPRASEDALRAQGIVTLRKVAPLAPPEAVEPRTDLAKVFTKLRVYNLTEYDKVVALDLDTLVVDAKVSTMFARFGNDRPAVLYRGNSRNWALNVGVVVMRPGIRAVGTSLDDMLARYQDFLGTDKQDTQEQGWLIAYWRALFAPERMEKLHRDFNFILASELREKIMPYKQGPDAPVILHWPGPREMKPWSCRYQWASNPFHAPWVQRWLKEAGDKPCSYFEGLDAGLDPAAAAAASTGPSPPRDEAQENDWDPPSASPAKKRAEERPSAPAPVQRPSSATTCRLAAPMGSEESKLATLFRVLREQQSNRWFAHGGHAINALRIGSPNMYFDKGKTWPINMDVDYDFQLIVPNQSYWTQEWGPRMNTLLKAAYGSSVALQSKIYPKNSYKIYKFCDTNTRSLNPVGHGAGDSCIGEFRPLYERNATHVTTKQQCTFPPTKLGECKDKYIFPLDAIFPLRTAKYGGRLTVPVPKTSTFTHALDLETRGLRLSAEDIALWPKLYDVAALLEGCKSGCRASVAEKCSNIHYCPKKVPRAWYSGQELRAEILKCQTMLQGQGFATFDLKSGGVPPPSRRSKKVSRTAVTTTAKPRKRREAYVTHLMGSKWDVYSKVAVVWARSIRRYDTERDIVILTTPDIPAASEARLHNKDDVTILKVPPFPVPETVKSRKDLGNVFLKLRVFNLTQYEKIVWLDLDCLVVSPDVTSLFDQGDSTVVVLDRGKRQKLNNGVFVMRPGHKDIGTSLDDMIFHFHDYIELAKRDTTDQGWMIEYWQRHGRLEALDPKYNFILRQQFRFRKTDVEFEPVVLHWPGFSNQKPWSCAYKYTEYAELYAATHKKYVDMWYDVAEHECSYFDHKVKK